MNKDMETGIIGLSVMCMVSVYVGMCVWGRQRGRQRRKDKKGEETSRDITLTITGA